MPHYPLVEETGPIHHAFTIGRVAFVVTDLRSRRDPPDHAVRRPPRSTMGEAQRSWLLASLRTLSRSHALVFWVNTSPWIADGGFFQDHWGKYADERRLIADAIERESIRNLMLLCGDAHMLAMDDGKALVHRLLMRKPEITASEPWVMECTSISGRPRVEPAMVTCCGPAPMMCRALSSVKLS